jgi:polysaccharide export outer membrane protein
MILKYFKSFSKILLLIIAGLLGCRTSGQRFIFSTAAKCGQKSMERNLAHHSYYNVIKPEDELLVRDLNHPEIVPTAGTEKNVYRVDADSNIHLPLVGKVKVGGLNRQQAAEKIKEAYGETELKAPIIDVQISNIHVTILGEVTRQGNYPISREDYELADLLGDAQGFSANADTETLKIFRGYRRAPTVIPVNMSHYCFMSNPDLVMRSGDIVYVAPKSSALKLKNAQQYSGLVQLGLLSLSTLFIIINR